MTARRSSPTRRAVVGLAAALIALGACGAGPRPVSGPASTAPVTPASPPAAGPPRVLVVGDSILFDAAPAVGAALEAAGVPAGVDAVLGLGLSRGPYFDWRAHWRRQVAEHDPDVVFVHVGPFDLVPSMVDGRPLQPGVPGWSPWYAGLLDEAAAVLTAHGATVRWINSLPYAKPGWQPDVAAFNRELVALAGRDARVTVVDGFGALSDHGRFLPELRKDDGIHLCPPGAERFADLVLTTIGSPAGADAAWRTGPWRQDSRYAGGLEGGHCPAP